MGTSSICQCYRCQKNKRFPSRGPYTRWHWAPNTSDGLQELYSTRQTFHHIGSMQTTSADPARNSHRGKRDFRSFLDSACNNANHFTYIYYIYYIYILYILYIYIIYIRVCTAINHGVSCQQLWQFHGVKTTSANSMRLPVCGGRKSARSQMPGCKMRCQHVHVWSIAKMVGKRIQAIKHWIHATTLLRRVNLLQK